MQSNGGISTVENASERPIGLLLSGPAGGVIGGRWTGLNCEKANIITIDIGGTSADISVIENGELRIKNPRDTEIAGLPVLVPMIDIDAIGAGGGSIAYIDPGGAFRVGPRSAGAVPGPACYGKGGTEPTVTDAQIVLGRMDPEQFLGGDLRIDASLSFKAIDEHVGSKLGLDTEQAALGILKIINNNMALAINANSVAKGVDPRDFSLMGFGGAGPLHAVSLAEAIFAKDVISPVQPGITAATGLLVTDLQYEYTQSTPIVLDRPDDAALAAVNAVLDDLKRRANQQLDADNVPEAARRFRRIAECRYLGQGFELRAEMPDEPLSGENLHEVVGNFYSVHKQVYGHAFKDQACEIITVRLVASVAVDTLTLPELAAGGRQHPGEALMYRRRTVFDDGTALDTPRYARDRLRRDDRVSGPALVIQHNSTTIIPPGYLATVMRFGDILIGRTSKKGAQV
jgi:N-methylhydantoinase A